MRRKIEAKPPAPQNKGLDIRLVPLSSLNPAKYNPRKDLQPGDKQYNQLEKSIKEFGNVDPIIWNETTGNVVGGHQRLKILRQGLNSDDKLEVSVVNLPERKEKMLNIALNKIGGDWDNRLLKSLLENINLEDFEMDIIGFDRDEINRMFEVAEDDYYDDEEKGQLKKDKDDLRRGILITVGFCDILVMPEDDCFELLYETCGKRYSHPEELKQSILEGIVNAINSRSS